MESTVMLNGRIYVYELPREGENIFLLKDENKFINEIFQIEGCKTVRWSDIHKGYEIIFRSPQNQLSDSDMIRKIEDIAVTIGYKEHTLLGLPKRIIQRIGYIFNKNAFKEYMSELMTKALLSISIFIYLMAFFIWMFGGTQDWVMTNLPFVVLVLTYIFSSYIDIYELHPNSRKLSMLQK